MDVASAAGMATVGALRAEAVDVVVFDLDGVLTDTAELHAAAWKQAFDADSDYRTHVNGYLGTRGAVPECAADGVHYPGSYLAGVYNRLRTAVDDHTLEHEHLVNVPDWLPLRFRVEGGDWFSPDTAELTVYRTELDLRNGVLTRVLRFRDAQGRHTAVRQRRLVHMDDPHLAALETVFTAEDWSGGLEVRCGIDGTVVNANLPEDEPLAKAHLEPESATADGDTAVLTVVTTQSRVRVAMAARTVVRDPIGRTVAVPRTASLTPHGFAGQVLHCELAQGQPLTVEKVVAVATSRDPAVSEPTLAAREAAAAAGGFAELLAAHERAWGTLWERFDLAVDADDEVVLALRLHTFHLLQTLSPHTAQLDAGVPACGLHGEGYHGHVFWDEMFVFPVLNLRLPALSRALLLYRWRRLDAARRSARCAGRSGAMFPWQSGSDGREETPTELYDTAARQWIPDLSHLQRHVAGGHHLAVGGRGHARGSFPLAIGVLQILALDIGTDLLPALALGAEPPNPRTLTCSPAWATPSMRRRSSRRTGGRRGTQHRRPATAPPTGRTGRRATGRPAGVVAAGCRGCHRGTRRLARYRDHRLGRVSEHRDRGGAAGPRRSA